MEYIIIFILSVAVVFILGKYIALNKQIKFIKLQLDSVQNRSVSVDFINHNIEELTISINKVLEHAEHTQIEASKNYKVLQQSIANISHDMRTPLTSVIGYLQLALKECSDEDLKKNIEIAIERAKYCNQLINDFYELSVAEARETEVHLEKVDLAGLLCEQILCNYIDFEKRGLVPNFTEAGRPEWVLADKIMLTRILQNLISNTLKYATGNVDFCIEKADDKTKLTVSNSVIQEDIDTALIFEKFYQNDLSRGKAGSGIGLYLCRCFVEKVGGSISADYKDGKLAINVFLLSTNS